VIARAAGLLLRLRLRRLYNLLAIGRRRQKPGARTGTARRTGWMLPSFVLAVNLFGAIMLSQATIVNARMRLDGLNRYEAGRASTLSAEVQDEMSLLVGLAAAVGLLMSLGTRELANPDWDLEWLATLPLPMRQLLIVRLLERTLINPVAVLALVPLLSVTAFHLGAGWWSPVAGLLVALPLLMLVGSAHLLVDTGLRLRLTPPRLRNVQAVAGITGLVGLYLMISAGQSNESLLHGWAADLPHAFRWTPPALAVHVLAAEGPRELLPRLGLLAGVGLLAAWGTVALLQHVLRDGLLAAGARESSRAAARPATSTRAPRRFITALQARELKLLARDRAFLVQTLVLPVVILGSQFVFNLRFTSDMVDDPRHLGAAAFAVMAYALLFSTFQTLAAEGHALWLLFTFPRPLDALLREKARLWSVVALIFPSLIFAFGLAAAQHPGWEVGAVAALVMLGVPIYATIGTCLGVLGWDPLALDQRRRVKPGWAWLYMLLASLFSYALFAKTWWESAVLVMLTGALALSLWQRVHDRLPYLLDPSERPPTRVSLSDGMIAALLFFVLQALVFLSLVTLQDDGETIDRALLPAYAVAGVLTFVALRVAYSVTKAEGVPRYLGGRVPAWRAAAPLALAGGLVAAGYVLVLRNTGLLGDDLQSSIDTLRHSPWTMGSLIIVVAPVFEEFLFRGLVYSGLRRSHGFLASALFSATVFAIVHPPVSVAPVFVLGLLTAAAYERSGALLAPVLVHAAFNAASFGTQLLAG
jgi:membrane protease YdiL (CAAX protease family)